MSQLRARTVAGLQAGDTFTITRVITREDTLAFGDLTRDYNPVHYDHGYAQARGFSDLICHGLLTGGMVCEVGGQMGWLASEMSFRFLKPVFAGDTITCQITVTEVAPGGRARARAIMTNQAGEVVVEADLGGVLPVGRARREMERMMAEGDPTNPLATNPLADDPS